MSSDAEKDVPPIQGPAESERVVLTVPTECLGMRLDRFLAQELQERGHSREKIKRAIREGTILVNGMAIRLPRHPLSGGDEISVSIESPPSSLTAEPGEIMVLYRDKELAVIDKPAGLVVHPAPGRLAGTLAHRLVGRFPELAGQEGFRPGIVHRLDKDTSGLLLVALTERTRLALSGMFARREIHKEYLALVHGVPERSSGRISGPLGRDARSKVKMAVTGSGKPALSEWKLLYADPSRRFALLAVRIFTGRTHQIRVHLEHIGHPLLGDALYKGEIRGKLMADRQMLHAWRLAFRHPAMNTLPEAPPLSFSCAPPEDFFDTIHRAGTGMLRVVITGSPGCGKSSLLALLAGQGLPVFSSDALVKRLYEAGGEGWKLLRARYGDRFVPDDREPVDKAALGQAMRESDAFRRELEKMIHPLVRQGLEEFWKAQEERGEWAAVAEIPLYLEANFNTPGHETTSRESSGRRGCPGQTANAESKAGFRMDAPACGPGDTQLADLLNRHPRPLLVGVHCPLSIRRVRLLENRGWDEATISMMESWQWPEERKMASCDWIVPNTGAEKDLRQAAGTLTRKLRRMYHLLPERLLEEIRLLLGKEEKEPFPQETN